MSFFDAIDIAASGLTAERLRMDVTAENLANAQTTRDRQRSALPAPGGRPPAGRQRLRRDARRRDRLAIRPRAASQVTGIVADPTPDKLVYDPGHPDANAQGYVRMPNVNPVTEMVDLISESRSYEAERDRDADRPSRCTPRPWTCSSDSSDLRCNRSARPRRVERSVRSRSARRRASPPTGAGATAQARAAASAAR